MAVIDVIAVMTTAVMIMMGRLGRVVVRRKKVFRRTGKVGRITRQGIPRAESSHMVMR
jgi:hypothetical protein